VNAAPTQAGQPHASYPGVRESWACPGVDDQPCETPTAPQAVAGPHQDARPRCCVCFVLADEEISQ